jgi:basic membrane protein A
MMGRIIIFTGALTALAAPPAGAFTLEGPPKIAWIYLNAKNDGGWQQAVDEARVKVEKELNTTIPYVENVPDDATKIKPAAERYIQRGYNIILGSSFGYSVTCPSG